MPTMLAVDEQEHDGPRDEVEIGEVVEAEVERLVRHPSEGARLRGWPRTGSGSAPYIEMTLVARWIIRLAVIVVGVALLVYFEA